jgi:hypothetical protein
MFTSQQVTLMAIVQATIVDLENLRNTLGDELFNKYAKCSIESSICHFVV